MYLSGCLFSCLSILCSPVTFIGWGWELEWERMLSPEWTLQNMPPLYPQGPAVVCLLKCPFEPTGSPDVFPETHTLHPQTDVQGLLLT